MDTLTRALAMDGKVRAAAISAPALVRELCEIHDAGPVATAALGRLALGTLLTTVFIEKLSAREPVVTVSIHGGGPLGPMTATASPSGWVRAMVKNAAAEVPVRDDGSPDLAAAVGTEGNLEVSRDPGFGKPFHSVVSLRSGEIADDLAAYLLESEQTPSAVALGVTLDSETRVRHAGGFMVQLLPEADDDTAAELDARVRALPKTTTLLDEGADASGMLARLFPEGVEEIGSMSPRFFCGCSKERVLGALKLLGLGEVARLDVEAEGSALEMKCGFCRTAYEVTAAERDHLIAELRNAAGTS